LRKETTSSRRRGAHVLAAEISRSSRFSRKRMDGGRESGFSGDNILIGDLEKN